MIELRLSLLPVPKSNRYIRKKGGKVFKPPRVKNWEVRALWEIKEQYKGEPLVSKLSVYVELVLPNHRRRDIDNMLKSLWDILEKGGVIKRMGLVSMKSILKRVIKGQQCTIVRIGEFKDAVEGA